MENVHHHHPTMNIISHLFYWRDAVCPVLILVSFFLLFVLFSCHFCVSFNFSSVLIIVYVWMPVFTARDREKEKESKKRAFLQKENFPPSFTWIQSILILLQFDIQSVMNQQCTLSKQCGIAVLIPFVLFIFFI